MTKAEYYQSKKTTKKRNRSSLLAHQVFFKKLFFHMSKTESVHFRADLRDSKCASDSATIVQIIWLDFHNSFF